MTKHRQGRPRKPATKRRVYIIGIRLTESERLVVGTLVDRSGLTLSEWCRKRLLLGVFEDG